MKCQQLNPGETKSLILPQLTYHRAILEGPPENITGPKLLYNIPNVFC